MAKDRDTSSDGASERASRDAVEQRVRRLERRLAKVREVEARRARKLDHAQRQGASEAVREARRRKLVKARKRGKTIERKLARVRSVAYPDAVDPAASPDVVEPAVVDPAASPDVADSAPGPQAYCLRERRTVVMVDPEETVMRNGRPALAGRCPSCGARVVRPVRSRPA